MCCRVDGWWVECQVGISHTGRIWNHCPTAQYDISRPRRHFECSTRHTGCPWVKYGTMKQLPQVLGYGNQKYDETKNLSILGLLQMERAIQLTKAFYMGMSVDKCMKFWYKIQKRRNIDKENKPNSQNLYWRPSARTTSNVLKGNVCWNILKTTYRNISKNGSEK